MNGYQYKDPLTESYDDLDIPFDHEAVATTGELFNPLGAVSSAIGGLLGGRGTRQPVRTMTDHRAHAAPGVRDARLETPRGNATIRLPEEVVPKRLFDETTTGLQQSVTGATARINTIEQKDLPEMKKEIGALLANTRQAIADEKKARLRSMWRQARQLKSIQTTNMMMSLLFQRQLQTQLESHTHSGDGAVPEGSSAEPAALGSSDSSLLFLPMMMMGDGGGGYSGDREDGEERESGGSDNSMMMMAMMMAVLK